MLRVQRHTAQGLPVAQTQLEVRSILENAVKTTRVNDSTMERIGQEHTA